MKNSKERTTNVSDITPAQPKQAEIETLYRQLNEEAEASGYHLNPDVEFTKDLVAGLLINQKRYGYVSCPCRLASGNRQNDLDIICPCDYRDADITDHGACYCALYVNERIRVGTQKARSIPERRPKRGVPGMNALSGREPEAPSAFSAKLSVPIWRCKVCGYLCAREGPPEKCPICKVPKERFERFIG